MFYRFAAFDCNTGKYAYDCAIMQNETYLTTEQAAAYLNLGERKLYELVAQGAVPCSKVTGKWLFPRGALDRWIDSGLSRPAGFVAEAAPAIVGGSHDLLLEWSVRVSGSGLALLPEGSETGLERLTRNEIALAAIHLHSPDHGRDANCDALHLAAGVHDAVMIGFCRREQGLVLAPDKAGIRSLSEAAQAGLRLGTRQKGAGSQLLLQQMLQESGPGIQGFVLAPTPYPTGQDLALAIRGGVIDCGIAPRSVAGMHRLAFLPLAQERFDLVMRRRTFFEPGMQALMAFMRTAGFARQAQEFGGYDIAGAGQVRLNR